jgi:hypothetical protein
MPEQYAATDKRTGLEVAVTGEFPPAADDRIRIARTTTLFTRLMSTITPDQLDEMAKQLLDQLRENPDMASELGLDPDFNLDPGAPPAEDDGTGTVKPDADDSGTEPGQDPEPGPNTPPDN